jgi:hypothetical protein
LLQAKEWSGISAGLPQGQERERRILGSLVRHDF